MVTLTMVFNDSSKEEEVTKDNPKHADSSNPIDGLDGSLRYLGGEDSFGVTSQGET